MDLKTYEKTRYQNIYRHKKNKNYVIMLSKPVKTSISRIDNEKILSIDKALEIRESHLKLQKKLEERYKKDSFDEVWNKYMNYCKYNLKLAYNTIWHKEKDYKQFFKDKFDIPLIKITTDFLAKYIDNLDTTNKQKNQAIKQLKPFFNWCIEENYINTNPMNKIKKYKVLKEEMKYWLPEDYLQFNRTIDFDINNGKTREQKEAYLIKIMVLIGFILGNRIGESRALAFGKCNATDCTVHIDHSINYDPHSKDFVSFTKTYSSQRIIYVTPKFIEEIEKYKDFLTNELGYTINDDTLILFNHELKKPYSDTFLRKKFYYYCDKAKVPRIRLYDLRHTHVATLMGEGIQLYQISERLGHTDYRTTVNKYGHLSKKVRKEIAKTTDKFI